ncbi:MAG: AI-2E family transporter [Legionellales bacterium]|nr:AI-2E family transporter [Legionellales bacterium]
MDKVNASHKWFWLTLTLISVGLVYLLSPILTPFFIGVILAYLGNPLVTWLTRWHLPRTLAVIVFFSVIVVVLLLLVLLLLPSLEQQITLLISQLPLMVEWVQFQAIPWITQHLGMDETVNLSNLSTVASQHWQQAGGFAGQLVKTISQSSVAIVVWLANLVLVPVVAFYLLRDWQSVLDNVHRLIPLKFEPKVLQLANECHAVLGGFLRGQLLVMVSLGAIYTFGLWLVGVNLAVLIGFVSGLVSIVPYLGFFIGVLLATIAALFQFGEWLPVLLVWVVFSIGTTIESAVLTPWLVGDRIGIHPVAVIFAIMVGGLLFGFLGILLALPGAAVLMVVLRHLTHRYMASSVYQQSI